MKIRDRVPVGIGRRPAGLLVVVLVRFLCTAHSHGAESLTTACNANVTNAAAVFTVPQQPKPAYLVPTIDPTFGTTVTRIGGNSGASMAPVIGTFGSDVRHHYHTDPPWSSDGSLYAIQNEMGGSPLALYLDGTTFVPRYGKCANYNLGDDWWNPNPAHPHERINVNGNRLSWFDVTTCTETRFWTLPFTGAQSRTEGTSWDGKYAPITDSTGKLVVIVEMDPAPGRVGPVHDVTNDCGANRASRCDIKYIDYMAVSPSGKYLVVWYNDRDYTRVYNINPATLVITPRTTSSAHVTGCHGTSSDGYIYDVGEASAAVNPFDNNEDVVVGQEQCGNLDKSTVLDSQGKRLGTVVMVRLKDGQITALTDPTNEGDARHISAISPDSPGWAYVSYHPSAGGARFRGEIVAVKMDGSLAVKRLAHSHTDYGVYRAEAHAVPSRDGQRVAFASSWSLNCGSSCGSTANPQDYVVDVCTTAADPCTVAPNGTACNDGNACTQTDTCQSGVCVGSNPVVCSAGDACHAASCDALTGSCLNVQLFDGSACTDGNACTQTDRCQSGVCVGSNPVVCAVSDSCHGAGTCAPATGLCSSPAAADGTACSDGNACTQSDTCQSGLCTGSSPVVCTAMDACHKVGTCIPTTGVCSNPTKPGAGSCDDGNACTTNDRCQSGVCTGTISPNGTACPPTGTCQGGVCTGTTSSGSFSRTRSHR